MVRVDNISFGYSRKSEVFNSFTFEFAAGNIYGILGRNGAGKTTLLRLISGLLYPKSGNCLMNGVKLTHRLPATMSELFFLPEEYELPPITLKKFINVNSVFYPHFSDDDLLKYTDEFELDLKKKLSSFSYGQKKKFLIAFGLATNASLLVLDEPTNALDIPSKSQFRKIMASCISDDRCIVISTHQVRDLENLIDPVVIIEKGEIIFNQTVESIASRLVFGDTEDRPDAEIIYNAGIEGRKRGVMINNKGTESIVDLEILFNAVIRQQEKMKTIFNG